MNNDQLAHNFCNDIGTRGQGSNFSFNDNYLYSYGTIIAVKHPKNMVTLITNSSTARHKGCLYNAIFGTHFEVPKIGTDNSMTKKDHAENLKYFKDNVIEAIVKLSRARNKWIHENDTENNIKIYNDYIDSFNLKRVKISIDNFNIDKIIFNFKNARKIKLAKDKKDRK